MARHSHWASIKHKKEALDAKRGKVFSKVVKLLMSAAREGGGDPTTNLKLRYAIDKAREVNMPSDNIERAIRRGTGEISSFQLEDTLYEGFAPGNVAILVEAITDNKNRSYSEIRKIFDTHGGKLGGTNSVAWLFQKKGLFTIPAQLAKEDELLEVAMEWGADDVQLVSDVFEITCELKDFERIKTLLVEKGFSPQMAKITYIPKNYVLVQDNQTAQKILELVEALQEHDDIQNVHSNYDIPTEVMAAIQESRGV